METKIVIYTNKNHQRDTSTNLKNFLEEYLEKGYRVISITPTITVFTNYLQEDIIILEK